MMRETRVRVARRDLEVRVRQDLASGVSVLVDFSLRGEVMVVYHDENDFKISVCDLDVRTNLDIELNRKMFV